MRVSTALFVTTLLMYLFDKYSKYNRHHVYNVPAFKRITAYKHQIQMHPVMKKVTVNILPFSIFVDSKDFYFFKGNRLKKIIR